MQIFLRFSYYECFLVILDCVKRLILTTTAKKYFI